MGSNQNNEIGPEDLNLTGSGSNCGLKKPNNFYVAHRRSSSELTALMVEQYNLQRQLEAVQAQQKQILQQQAHQVQQQQFSYSPKLGSGNAGAVPDLMPPSATFRSQFPVAHGPNNGGHGPSHRPSGSISSPHGHNRRHSLGLNEAIKAAANQRQTNNASLQGSKTQSLLPDSTSSNPLYTTSGSSENITLFKFPAQADADTDTDSSSSYSGSGSTKLTHNRSRSFPYQQQAFKFPPENTGAMAPPSTSLLYSQSPERGHQRRGSHYRTNSRSFDPNGAVNMNSNWRLQQQHLRNNSSQLEPPHSFIPDHRARNTSYGGGSSISSLSHFMPNNNNNSNGRKSLFAPYLPQSSLPELINEGRLVIGTLRVNKKNRSDAYVSTDGLLDADIFICGSKDRNRALEGDLVAVELLVVDEVWEAKKEKEEKKRRKDNSNYAKMASVSVLNDDIHNDATSATSSAPTTSSSIKDKQERESDNGVTRRGSLKQRPTMKKNDDVEVEGQSLLLVEEEEINDDIKPLYAGHIVAVVDRIPGQIFAGTLGLLRPAQAAQAAKDIKSGKEPSVQHPKAPKIVWFKPTDKKVPLIAIPTEQAPKDFVENHDKYANQLFVASIKRWPITSLHPFGTLINKLGTIDDPQTEVVSILRDNNFLCDEYPSDSGEEGVIRSYINSLPSVENELSNGTRVEYLNEYIVAFSQNGEFVDHALHVKRLSNVKIELGFHAVDISFFIKGGSVLDRKAKKRSSSVFLPQRVEHLYPAQINDVLSFHENEKNLALSVVFEIDTTTFEVESLLIHESVIIPKQIVTYTQFDQTMVANRPEEVKSATSDYLKTFGLIAKEFRRQRLNSRNLGLAPNLSLLDYLDDERVNLLLNIFKDNIAFDIINEISHKVNSAVATKIHAKLGDFAFLRRQPLPTLQKIEAFVRKTNNLGFKIDTTDSAVLQKSVLSIDDPIKRQCVETLLFKCMSRGKYFVAGNQDPDSYGHYYFNLPLYTHFNAPLRRYADLIAHRQLKAVLNKATDDVIFDLESLKATADYCNFKKDCAYNAQEQAVHLLLSQTINEMSGEAGQVLCMGTVIQVYESSFDVFIPEFGIEKRVHGDQLPLVKAEFDKNSRVFELYWERGADSATYIPPDEQSSLSYRNSIKNKFRMSSRQAAQLQESNFSKESSIDKLSDKLSRMGLEVPHVNIPSYNNDNQSLGAKSGSNSPSKLSLSEELRRNSSRLSSPDRRNVLKPYLQNLKLRVENNYYIQEVSEMAQVPILLRAEIGMALPCLTVRVLNPFCD